MSFVLPVFLVIALGLGLRHLRGTPANLFAALGWLTFYVAFPCLMFLRTAQLELEASTLRSLVLLVLLPMAAVLAIVLLGLRLLPAVARPTRSSIVQGAVRPSTYFGLSVAGLVFPHDTATLVMLALAICMPIVNVVAVVALAWWGEGEVSAARLARMVARNPIIVSTIAGGLFNASGLALPSALGEALRIVADIALGLGLLCVGGGLSLRLEALRPLALLATSTLKLAVLPAATWLCCRLLGTAPEITLAACFYAALPCAPNAYIMARQMGGDAELMASLITLQTVLAALTLPLWLMLLQPAG